MAVAVIDQPTVISPALAKRLFDTSLDLIMVTDRRGRFIDISPSALAILGYRPEEMIGRIGTEFIYPEDLDRTRNEMREARRGRLTRNFETRYVHKSGHSVTLDWTGLWLESEQVHCFIGRDVTQAKLTERMKDEFVATVSHELRTPLTSIAGALGLLVGNEGVRLPPSTLRLLTIAQANSQRLMRLVASILDVNKIEAGKVVFARKQLDVRALVEQAIASNRAVAEEFGVRITLDAAPIPANCAATPTGWSRSSITSCPTRSSSRQRAARWRSKSSGGAPTSASACATAAKGFRNISRAACSSDLRKPTIRTRAPLAAPASGSASSRRS